MAKIKRYSFGTSVKNNAGGQSFVSFTRRGGLQGKVLIHVDDFIIVGTLTFIEKMRKLIAEALIVSTIAYDQFRFTGWDIHKYEDRIGVSMKDYANSIDEVKEIRR